jgi:hypothetical protein
MAKKKLTKAQKKTADELWEYSTQANMQMSSDGIVYTGGEVMTASVDMGTDPELSYSFGDLGQLDMFDEMDMRDKYPALKQAYEHYQSVLEVCKTKEKEENED